MPDSLAPTQMIFGSDTVTQTGTGTDNSAYTVKPTAATGTGYTPPATSSPTSSSSDFRNYIGNVGTNIGTLQNNGNSLQQLLQSFATSFQTASPTADNSMYEDRRKELGVQQQNDLNQLNANYNQLKSSYDTQKTNDLQPINDQLSLVGTSEFGPNAALKQQLEQKKQSIMLNYQNQLNTLFQAQQNAVLQAHNAYADKDFALAEAESKNAKDAQTAFYNKQKDFADLFMRVYDQEQQDSQLDYQTKQAQQKFNNDNGIVSAFYQLPGSSTVYSSQTGKPLTYQEYLQMGGAGKPGAAFPDVQVVQPQVEHSTAYKEWQDYIRTGGKLNFNDYMNMDANRKATRITNISPTNQYDLQVKQAPAQVSNLRAQGYDWNGIATYFKRLGIDPGTPEIDDALHREFQSQKDYETWKANSYNTSHGITQ